MKKIMLIIIGIIAITLILFKDRISNSNPEKDLEKAEKLFTKACEISYHRWQESPKALSMLRKSANFGYTKAESELGNYLTYNDNCNKEGISWLKKAAEKGDFRASIHLAWVYLSENYECDEYYEDNAETQGLYYLLKAAEKNEDAAELAEDNAIKLGVQEQFSQAYYD